MINTSTHNVDNNAAHVFLFTPFKPTNVTMANRITILLQIATTFDVLSAFRKNTANIIILIPTVIIVNIPFRPAASTSTKIKIPNSITSSVSRFTPLIPEPLTNTLSPL